jgi:hypothetical protein
VRAHAVAKDHIRQAKLWPFWGNWSNPLCQTLAFDLSKPSGRPVRQTVILDQSQTVAFVEEVGHPPLAEEGVIFQSQTVAVWTNGRHEWMEHCGVRGGNEASSFGREKCFSKRNGRMLRQKFD